MIAVRCVTMVAAEHVCFSEAFLACEHFNEYDLACAIENVRILLLVGEQRAGSNGSNGRNGNSDDRSAGGSRCCRALPR